MARKSLMPRIREGLKRLQGKAKVAKRRKTDTAAELTQQWTLPPAATLGSSVRARGILLEIRAHLPWVLRMQLDIEGMVLTLRMPKDETDDFRAAAADVSAVLKRAESLPVIPREVEDILTISATERHRWLKDGRLQSAGTRTVKLRGRKKKITFHVFDPRHIEDVLDRDLMTLWREEDAATAAENRRRAAGKAALARARKQGGKAASAGDEEHGELQGWEEFESEGFLR